MRDEVWRDLSRSARVFVDVVWPAISDYCDGGRLKPTEGATDRGLESDLDTLAGIDGFQMLDKYGTMRSIASRVQWIKEGYRPYRTFTIRAARPNGSATEREKRQFALAHPDRGFLAPHLTIQAYVREGTDALLSVGIIRTADLYACDREHPCQQTKVAGNGGEQFVYYGFDDLKRLGYRVKVWPQSQLRLMPVADPWADNGGA